MATEAKKSLDQLLEQALAERSREEDQVEVTYELAQEKLVQGDGDDDNAEPLGSVELERRATRNTITLGTAVVLCCSGLASLHSLQSALYPRTGADALCALYSLAALSCLGAPATLHTLGPNWTWTLHAVASVLYLACFYVGEEWGLVAGCALLGLTSGPALCALATRASLDASRLPCLTSATRDAGRQRFLKRLLALAHSSLFWGSLVTSLVTRFGVVRDVALLDAPSPNASSSSSPEVSFYEFCFRADEGVADLVLIQLGSMHRGSLRVLVLIFGASVAGGVLVVSVFLERLDFLERQDPLERPLLLRTMRQMRLVLVDKEIRLAVPLVLFTGLEQGFILADFTRSYVSCSLGLESIVLTMMCLGGCNTLGSVAVHLFSEHIERTAILAAGLVCQSGLLLVLYLWTPARDDAAVFYVLSGGWGLCNAVWETLTITYLAKTSIDSWQIPFTTYYLVQCLGTALSFSFTNYLGSAVKVCILASSLAISVVPYTILEFRIHHRNILNNRAATL